MSPNDVPNFVHSLVEMARAMEELPSVKAALLQQQNANLEQGDIIAKREASIIGYKVEIENLHARIRDLEVARDDAELRFLEADERMDKIAKSFQVALEAMDATDRLVTSFSVKPEPEVQAQPVTTLQGQSETLPQTSTGACVDGMTSSASHTDHTAYTAVEGQSEAPLPAPSTEAPSAPTASATEEAATELTQQTSGAIPAQVPYNRRFSGIRYYDHPVYVRKDDWLAGGGSEEDYEWRPEVKPRPIF